MCPRTVTVYSISDSVKIWIFITLNILLPKNTNQHYVKVSGTCNLQLYRLSKRTRQMERLAKYLTTSISLVHIRLYSYPEIEFVHGMNQVSRFKQAVANANCTLKHLKWLRLKRICRSLLKDTNTFTAGWQSVKLPVYKVSLMNSSSYMMMWIMVIKW